MKRRDLLIAIPAVVAAAVAARKLAQRDTNDSPDDGARAELDRELGPALLPSAPGALALADVDGLWALAQRIGSQLDLRALTRADFEGTLALKTRGDPSYLAEYRSALALSRVRDPSWARLVDDALALPASLVAEPLTALAHFRCFVVDELLALHLIRGGVRGFGFENYRGYVPGTFVYRKAEDG